MNSSPSSVPNGVIALSLSAALVVLAGCTDVGGSERHVKKGSDDLFVDTYNKML